MEQRALCSGLICLRDEAAPESSGFLVVKMCYCAHRAQNKGLHLQLGVVVLVPIRSNSICPLMRAKCPYLQVFWMWLTHAKAVEVPQEVPYLKRQTCSFQLRV